MNLGQSAILIVAATATTLLASEFEAPSLKPILLQLTDADFEVREAATVRLRRMGAQIFPALEAARERSDDPELHARLDLVLAGPQLCGQPASYWIHRVRSGDYDERMEALGLLGEAGSSVFPQAQRMCEDPNPVVAWTGLWLCVRLGEEAVAAGESVRKRLNESLEDLESDVARLAEDTESWPLYLQPRDLELGDPPLVDFYLGSREGDGVSYPYEIKTAVYRAIYEQGKQGLIQPFNEMSAARQLRAHLWGIVQAYAYSQTSQRPKLFVHPALRLQVLAWSLEGMRPDEADLRLIRRAQWMAMEILSGGTAKP